jgi:hypothetical protein
MATRSICRLSLQPQPWSSYTRRDFLFAAPRASLGAPSSAAGGRLLGTIPFGAPGARRTPLERLLGKGLDARLFTDLSTLGNPPIPT